MICRYFLFASAITMGMSLANSAGENIVDHRHRAFLQGDLKALLKLGSFDSFSNLNDDPCSEQILLQNFSIITSELVRCILNHSSPASVCLNCKNQYFDFYTLYGETEEELFARLALTLNDDECKVSEVFRKDLYVKNAYTNLNAVWNKKSRCNNCLLFPTGSELNNEGQPVTLSNATKEFLLAYKNFNLCVNESESAAITNESEICTKCLDQYQQVNGYYKRFFYGDDSEPWCLDLITLLNETVYFWKEKNCSSSYRRSRVPIEMNVLWGVLIVLPLLFYICLWLFGSKQKRVLRKYRRRRMKSGQRRPFVTVVEESILTPDVENERLLTNAAAAESKHRRIISYSLLPKSALG